MSEATILWPFNQDGGEDDGLLAGKKRTCGELNGDVESLVEADDTCWVRRKGRYRNVRHEQVAGKRIAKLLLRLCGRKSTNKNLGTGPKEQRVTDLVRDQEPGPVARESRP